MDAETLVAVRRLLLEKVRLCAEQAEAHRRNMDANLGAAQVCRQLLADLAQLASPASRDEPGQDEKTKGA